MLVRKPEKKQQTVQQKSAAGASAKAGVSRAAVSVLKPNPAGLKSGPSVFQLRAYKRVEESAKKHYGDGWGAKYGIQTDEKLKEKVPDSVKGSGSIFLNNYEKNRWRYAGAWYRNLKRCEILYNEGADGWGSHRFKYTTIYHCGPSGAVMQQHWDGAKWVY